MTDTDISYFFNPKSIAVIGASITVGKVGNTVLNNIIKSGYSGKIYPINPKAEEICGHNCYKSVSLVNFVTLLLRSVVKKASKV